MKKSIIAVAAIAIVGMGGQSVVRCPVIGIDQRGAGHLGRSAPRDSIFLDRKHDLRHLSDLGQEGHDAGRRRQDGRH